MGGRRDERHRQPGDHVRHAVRAGLQRRTADGRGVRQPAQHRVRTGRPAGHGATGRARIQPPAPPVAALPPRPPHRRSDQGDRARDQEHRHDALFHAVQYCPHSDPAGRGRGDLLPQFRLAAGRIDRAGGGRLYLGDPGNHRMADQAARTDEPARRAGAGPGGRFAAQLRDGEILQRGGARGSPLCPGHPGLCPRRGEEREQPGPAQHRPGAGHQPADGRGAGTDGARLGPGRIQRRTAGLRPDLSDPAVPPARHAGHGLSHDPPGADRHGRHVPADRYRDRGAGRPRRPGAGGEPPDPGL